MFSPKIRIDSLITHLLKNIRRYNTSNLKPPQSCVPSFSEFCTEINSTTAVVVAAAVAVVVAAVVVAVFVAAAVAVVAVAAVVAVVFVVAAVAVVVAAANVVTVAVAAVVVFAAAVPVVVGESDNGDVSSTYPPFNPWKQSHNKNNQLTNVP